MKALDILDQIIESLASHGLMIILDNHVSDASWCCSGTDRNGLWYNSRYSEENWINDWKGMAKRYMQQNAVVGVDLRNELRPSCDFPDGCRTPVWGGGNSNIDWHKAAQLCGNAIHSVNPNLLIIVEGLAYSSDQTGVYTLPLVLSVPNKVVYEAHDYSWFHAPVKTFGELHQELGNKWGFIITQGKNFTAPVWVGEFGACHSNLNCIKDNPGTAGYWFEAFVNYLTIADIDWSWWALDGTQSSGAGRTWGDEEGFGILNMKWDAPASTALLQQLQAIQKATQGPGIDRPVIAKERAGL